MRSGVTAITAFVAIQLVLPHLVGLIPDPGDVTEYELLLTTAGRILTGTAGSITPPPGDAPRGCGHYAVSPRPRRPPRPYYSAAATRNGERVTDARRDQYLQANYSRDEPLNYGSILR
jgi:hypothetical protein